jgi:hypothetical protein
MTLVGVTLLAAAIALTSAYKDAHNRASDAEQQAQTVTVERDATAAQAGNLADQVAAACAAGGAPARALHAVPLAGGVTVDACRQASAVQASPIVQAVGPSESDIAAAVAAYLAAHPPASGQPSLADVTTAVGDYLAAHPPAGLPPTAEQVYAAVSQYLAAHPATGPQGPPGPGVTQAQIAAAVADYMAAHPVPACPAGEHLGRVTYADAQVGSGCVADDQPGPPAPPATTAPAPPAGDTTAPPAGAPAGDGQTPPATSTPAAPPDAGGGSLLGG